MKQSKKDKQQENHHSEKYTPDNQGLLNVDNPKDVDEAAAEVNRDWKKLQKIKKTK